MNIKKTSWLVLLILLISSLLGCTHSNNPTTASIQEPDPTLSNKYLPSESRVTQTTELEIGAAELYKPSPTLLASPTLDDSSLVVKIDPQISIGPISPLIYGLSGGESEYHTSLQPTFLSWGGNPSTRFNWKLGNAWNAGKDWFYMNGTYDHPDGVSVADKFLKEARKFGIATRLAVPTLGWVAKDTQSCSFPQADGSCGTGDGATCEKPDNIANPETANVASDQNTIAEWMQHLEDLGILPTYVAMDNEPELWGFTHYDVHPQCTTYAEILEKYLAYAEAVHSVAPEVKLAGPVTCCWFSYWRIAPGPVNPGPDVPQDFIAWFLQSVHNHDEASGWRSLDALDVHFYPQVGVYNDNTDPETSALRLRSTRALWDPTYWDESWINEPIYFIPRMKQLIDQFYPGTQFGISEWNWGADSSINGALAIADVLGIFGREGVTYAAYWRNPPQNSPGFLAFKLYTNYDENGGRFIGNSVQAASSSPDTLSSYAIYDGTSGQLKLMLINKDPEKSANVQVNISNYDPQSSAEMYRLASTAPQNIVASELPVEASDFIINLPAYSITLVVLTDK